MAAGVAASARGARGNGSRHYERSVFVAPAPVAPPGAADTLCYGYERSAVVAPATAVVVAPPAVVGVAGVTRAEAGAATGRDRGPWMRRPVHALRAVSKGTPTLAVPGSLCLSACLSSRYSCLHENPTAAGAVLAYRSIESLCWRHINLGVFRPDFIAVLK